MPSHESRRRRRASSLVLLLLGGLLGPVTSVSRAQAVDPTGGLELVDWWAEFANSAESNTARLAWEMTLRGDGRLLTHDEYQAGSASSGSLNYHCHTDGSPGGGGGGVFPFAEDLVSISGENRTYRRALIVGGNFGTACEGYGIQVVDADGGVWADYPTPEALSAAGFQRTWTPADGFARSVELRLTHARDGGWAFTAELLGFDSISSRTVSCFREGQSEPYEVETASFEGRYAGNLCFDDHIGEHWVEIDGASSNVVQWGATTDDPLCGDAALVGARGSGDNGHGVGYPGQHAIDLAQRLQAAGLTLYDNFDSNPNDHVTGVAYPAASVLPLDGELDDYPESVDLGVENLITTITSIRVECGDDFPILLVGFSQGADVVQGTLNKLDRLARDGDSIWRSVAGAALLASPRFTPKDPAARATFARSYPLAGIRPNARASIPARFREVSRSYCLANDPVCQFTAGNLLNHTGIHTGQYVASTSSGNAIANDVVGLFRWGLRNSLDDGPPTTATGNLRAYRQEGGERNRVLVSAAGVYANGAPSLRFLWDFDRDGDVDRATRIPWVIHNYGVRLPDPLPGPKAYRAHTRVKVIFADESSKRLSICIRRVTSGATTC